MPHAGVSFAVVVAAAGVGRRMGGCKKPLLRLCGRPILYFALEALRSTPGCAQIVPVLHPDECARVELAAELRREFGVETMARGGPTRQDSVLSGLEALCEGPDVVLIHDAVRPLVEPAVVQRVAEAADTFGAAIAAVRVRETVKEVDAGDRIVSTPAREQLWLARTPQGFRRELILRAHRTARDEGFRGTDDAQLVERLGEEVRVVDDTYDNLKITTEEDLALAEAILRWREAGRGGG
ncbi:MAG: 2-C-methyl-D-erythritol 4-phosphate cytidylyltransferase [Planctomycetota bacterium]|jgi:2-C-methyl-D-erythritol 4-phosphate cytidylyltransferase